MKRACLVFSGGGLRGISQFGCMIPIKEYLQKNKIRIDTLVGTSFGSITASSIARGLDPKDVANHILRRKFRFTELVDFRFKGPGLLKGKKLRSFLKRLIGDIKYSDLKKELLINATDLFDGKEYIFTRDGLLKKGGSLEKIDFSLLDAVISSCSVPGVFTPVQMKQHIFVDGGVISPLGLDLIDPSKYDVVIAVDVCMANFDFLSTKNDSKIQTIAQAVSVSQRQYHFKNTQRITKKHKNVFVIRPPIGPVNIKKKGEFKRLIDTGIETSRKILGI